MVKKKITVRQSRFACDISSISDGIERLMDKGLNYAGILNLDRMLWEKHKALAKAGGIDTTKGGWFQSLTARSVVVGRQRDAIDILVKIGEQDGAWIIKTHYLHEVYKEALKELIIPNKEVDPFEDQDLSTHWTPDPEE